MRAGKLTIRALAAAAAALALAGAPARAQDAPPQAGAQVPSGYGTLKQDVFTVALRSGALLVKVTPLAESVIRLAAPDTYIRLHALAESRRADAEQRVPGGQVELFLVSFFSYQPDVTFQPEDLQLTSQGRILRPAAILPMTSGWGSQRLGQQETQAAVYVFDGDVNYEQPLTVRYELQQSSAWSDVVATLDAERAKVRSRAQAEKP
jgi:hypothetical protein